MNLKMNMKWGMERSWDESGSGFRMRRKKEKGSGWKWEWGRDRMRIILWWGGKMTRNALRAKQVITLQIRINLTRNRIRIRFRIRVKSRIRIHIKVKSGIRIRINVMRIRDNVLLIRGQLKREAEQVKEWNIKFWIETNQRRGCSNKSSPDSSCCIFPTARRQLRRSEAFPRPAQKTIKFYNIKYFYLINRTCSIFDKLPNLKNSCLGMVRYWVGTVRYLTGSIYNSI
jgi:hypothetical protein